MRIFDIIKSYTLRSDKDSLDINLSVPDFTYQDAPKLSPEELGYRGELSLIATLTNHAIPGSFILLNNLYVPNGYSTSEIDLVMVHEKGFFVFENKNYRGWIYGSAGQQQWTQTFSSGQKFQFYNPILQNKAHINALSNYLNIPTDEFFSIIVFSDECVLKTPPISADKVVVIQLSSLVSYLNRKLSRSSIKYSQAEKKSIVDKLKVYRALTPEDKQLFSKAHEEQKNDG